MQNLSFDLNNGVIEEGIFSFSCEVFTFENLYTVAEGSYVRSGRTYRSTSMRVHGGQTEAKGSVSLSVERQMDSTYRLSLDAALTRTIRSVKLNVSFPANARILSLINGTHHRIDHEGLLLRYPEGWRDVTTPLVVLEADDGLFYYFRSMDNHVREKRFYIEKCRDSDLMHVELIHEELATRMKDSVSCPVWEIGVARNLESIYRKHAEMLIDHYGLVPFEERNDVPDWFKDISLVVTCHMQHWTGHVFNTYDDCLNAIEKISHWIDAKHILVYLPGWEGRYYFKYGDYSPDDRLGGANGLKRMVDGLHALGARVMPMYGINLANPSSPNFEQWGKSSEFTFPSGAQLHHGSVDWDASRHYDHFTNANLNPAAPKWQVHLVRQIKNLSKTYGFDGAFLDIAAVWINDSNHDLVPGIYDMVEKIREGNPEFLVGGEGWYDGLTMAMPLFQSGHTDGKMHYHDVPYEGFFTPYAREFAHLSLGDVSRGSTGCHELGFNPITNTPYRKGILPTLALVDRTIEKEEVKVKEIVAHAIRYKKEIIDGGTD